MKPTAQALLISAAACAAWLVAAPAAAQDRIYRCGNEYTNKNIGKRKDCVLVEGGNVTVIESGRRYGAARSSAAPSGRPAGATASAAPRRADSPAQRERDADARAILENELQRAETRQAELEREYNNGQPEKNALEMRNPAKYNERVGQMKDAIDRNRSDIEGIRRELARFQKGA